MGTYLRVFSWVLFKNIGHPLPASTAFAYQLAHKHHPSPSFKPGNPNSGCGVIKSLPASFIHSKHSVVTLAQTVWSPWSFSSVLQQPSRNQPVHLQLKDPNLPIAYTLEKFDEPAQRYCPVGV